jgi:hypothetical protein
MLEGEEGVTLAAFTAWVLEAKAEKDRQIQMYLDYRRDCERTGDASGVQGVAVSLPAVKVKMRRPTKLVGDDRRTGNNRKKPFRLVAGSQEMNSEVAIVSDVNQLGDVLVFGAPGWWYNHRIEIDPSWQIAKSQRAMARDAKETAEAERCGTCRFCSDCSCHRYPPLPAKVAWETRQPIVDAYSGWCGEWERKL